ncbi:MAG: 2TM domain-containing protein [bacterium]|nr:2TM domain-containing protein [bacterium]
MTDSRYQEAKKRVEGVKGLFIHLAIYVAVNLGLFIVDLATGSGWWFYWATIMWGMGLAAHAVALYFDQSLRLQRWEEGKVEEYVRDVDGPGMNPAH